MGLQEGTRAVNVGKPFSSRQGKLEKGFVPCTAANPSGRREKQLQWAALAEVSGATCLQAPLLLLILAGGTHMPSLLHLHCVRHAPSPAPLYCWEVSKSQSWSRGLETSLTLLAKSKKQKQLALYPHFSKGYKC